MKLKTIYPKEKVNPKEEEGRNKPISKHIQILPVVFSVVPTEIFGMLLFFLP